MNANLASDGLNCALHPVFFANDYSTASVESTCLPKIKNVRSTNKALSSPDVLKDWVVPSNPPSASRHAVEQERLAASIYQFTLVSSEKDIFNFLKAHVDSSKLLIALPSILADIYSNFSPATIEVLLDLEAEKQVMMIGVVTEILDEVSFLQAEANLFNLIEERNLEGGLDNVILSLY